MVHIFALRPGSAHVKIFHIDIHVNEYTNIYKNLILTYRLPLDTFLRNFVFVYTCI